MLLGAVRYSKVSNSGDKVERRKSKAEDRVGVYKRRKEAVFIERG